LDKFKYSNDPTTLAKKFNKKKNAAVRFWVAKFCFKRHHFDEYYNILQSIKRGNLFIYAELLREYNNHDDGRFKKLENEALKKFSNDENILIECCIRYVNLEDGDNLLRILNMMDKETAAFMFYTGLYYSILGDQIRKIYAFKKAIEIDLTFHEAYLQLGIYYGEKDPVSGLQYLRDSLKIVSCHDEVRSSIKEIIRLENILTVNRKKQQYVK
jgi:tetratricopeptide (TPR) repeat protein